ncbi:MAG TPA: maleylacetoacetate isomerase [Anaeromyxobacteraceae bacterium]|nr:maleylacetoacetate isomerase [Anaeromyxobacteraceae bacterium]
MTLTLHSYWRSSCSWRVRIALRWKGLPFAYRAVNLLQGEQLADAHRARNPMATVPLLEVEEGGRTLRLAQSMAILEWLEERFPVPALLPGDPAGRARVRAIAEDVNSSIQPYQNSSTMKWLREREAGLDVAFTSHFVGLTLGRLEEVVRDGAGRFCHGDVVTLADLFVVPQLYGARRFGVDVARFPTLLRVEANTAALPAFAESVPDRQPDAVVQPA